MKSLFKTLAWGVCVLTMTAYGTTRGADPEPRGSLTVFHAGSMSVPMKAIAAEFKKLHPDLEMLLEAGGSRECARKITELGRRCDVLVSADYQVIDQLLIPEHAAWNIRFATNEMAIVYGEKSRRGDEINARNWHEILLDKSVAFGRSDPNSDPCGYRAVLTMKLAEKHYQQPGLAEQLLAKDIRFTRPKETDLLALLETGTIDYIFLYRSVAHQHHLKYLPLPDEINLKNPRFNDLYQSVSVSLTGKAPGETVTQKGEVMVYGITIPTAAPNPDTALAFVRFFLEAGNGMRIIEEQGQPSALPSETPTYDQVPKVLKPFVRKPEEGSGSQR